MGREVLEAVWPNYPLHTVPGIPTQANTTPFFQNPTFGPNMGIDPGITETLTQWVHGGGTGEAPLLETAWTVTQSAGMGWDFAAITPPPASGTFCISAIGGSNGSVAQFNSVGATNQVEPAVDGTTHIVFDLFIQSWTISNSGRDCLIRLFNGATAVSDLVSIKGYLPSVGASGFFRVRVPIADLNFTGTIINRVELTITSPQVDIAFDNIQFQEILSEGEVYTIAPPEGFMYIVEAINWTIVDDHDTLASGEPAIDHDKIGNETLANGLLFQFKSDAFDDVNFVTTSVFDVRRVGAHIEKTVGETPAGQGLPGQVRVMLQLKSDQARPFVVRSSQNESLNYTVRDDLSGIIELQICALAAILPEPT